MFEEFSFDCVVSVLVDWRSVILLLVLVGKLVVVVVDEEEEEDLVVAEELVCARFCGTNSTKQSKLK